MTGGRLVVHAPDGAPEVQPGDDLAALVLDLVTAAVPDGLCDGDIVSVTSKVVAKAEGQVRTGDREAAIAAETVRVVARRGATAIVRTRHGLTLAAAGVDASNVTPGSVVLLPRDPDASARSLRQRLHDLSGRNVAVLITDTAGRAWREGQTDLAIGAAGLRVVESFRGRLDGYGNPLAVTAPAVADELASAAELAQGKLTGRPFAVLRGRADLVLPAGSDGPGAVALVRPESADFFGWGAREGVLRALRGEPGDAAPFGAPVTAAELIGSLTGLAREATATGDGPDDPVVVACAAEHQVWAVRVATYALGWLAEDVGTGPDSAFRLRLRPAVP